MLIISRIFPCPILRLCAVREVLYMGGSFLLPKGGAQRKCSPVNFIFILEKIDNLN